MSSTPLSHNFNINALLSGRQWGSVNGQAANITYSFPDSGSDWGSNYPEVKAGWYSLTANEQVRFEAALAAWADVANLHFTKVSGNSLATQGQIRVAFSDKVHGDTNGWAYYPSKGQVSETDGDVWLNPSLNDFRAGYPNYKTMIHELGHALGLKHSFEAEGTNTATLSGVEDNNQYTMMSYNSYHNAGYNSDGTDYVRATTPMLYDIAAIQFLYGANMTTRTGDDSYTFSNTQGEQKTIWDAGGIDTFDLSNQTLSQTINLNAGQFSSLGVKRTYSGSLVSQDKNIAIAYKVSIEKAIGGSGNDTITGNALNNTLSGGQGNDKIIANVGDDVLAGGAGNDTLTGGQGHDTFVFNTLSNAGVDSIKDFNVIDDTIQLAHSVFSALPVGTLASNALSIGLTAANATARIIYNDATGALSYDIDGTGSSSAVRIAILGTDLALSQSDFIIA